MEKVTIREVAKAAQVSISTVSRYLNGNTKIEPLSRMRIEKAVRELEYSPNAAARSLKSQQTHVIGIIVSDIGNPFFISICKALEEVLSQYDYNLIICSSYENRDKEYKHLRMMAERRVDALVVCPSGKNNDMLLSIKNMGTPVIVLDRAFDDLSLDRIIENTGDVCKKMTKQLLALGHQRIACLLGSEYSQTAQVRINGVREAYEEVGIAMDPTMIFSNCLDEWGAYRAAEKAMRLDQPPTAFFAMNPRTTNGFLMYAIRSGMNIPKDASFVGITLKNNFTIYPKEITRIEQDPESIGLKAGELIAKLLGSERKTADVPVNIEFEQRIVQGETVSDINVGA